MRALPSELHKQLEDAVLAGRRAAESGVRAALSSFGVQEEDKPAHLDESRAQLRRGLRAKQRQLGGDFEVLLWECAYEQWHRLLFARFLAENRLLQHPEFGAPVTLAECEELAAGLGEPDGWSVAGRFAAEILPGIFRLDDPCVQLRLAPEHRVALENVVAGLPRQVFVADDSLGWAYQYWQKERKEQVNASEVKIGGADLGAVTQLFTENYMVRFLLENSLGAWWAARHPDSPLIKEFEYLRFDDDGQPAAGTFDGWPDRVALITVMDPCCGSGHFLVEAFGMLWRMRAEEEGLDPVGAQDAVLQDNLFGLELDPRCVQIAMFAVALTAWKHGVGWRELPVPHIACSGIPAKAPLNEWTALADGDERLEPALERLHTLFRDADTLGSLIDPRRTAEMVDASGIQRSFDDVDFDEIEPLLEKAAARETNDPAIAVLGADAAGIARAARLLSRQYQLVVTNPPYLGSGKQSPLLRLYCEDRYPDGCADLAFVFLIRSSGLSAKTGGVFALVLPDTWRFIPSYASLRDTIVRSGPPTIVGELGVRAFRAQLYDYPIALSLFEKDPAGPISGELSFIVIRFDRESPSDVNLRTHRLERVTNISGSAVTELKQLNVYATPYEGLSTGDGSRYQRKIWEVPRSGRWRELQVRPAATAEYGGAEELFMWEHGEGVLAKDSGARIQGIPAWGHLGVLVERQQGLRSSLFLGTPFFKTSVALVARDPKYLPAIWAFVRTEEYREAVRALDPRVGIATSATAAVAFDVERWQRVAEEEYPDGLPEPWSDDPTQWLFEGRPEVSTEPLQVAIGRLLGYRWPGQAEADEIDEFADRDGIVCLPAVARERPAAERLQTLLARAYGGEWAPGTVRKLLEQAGSTKRNLADWLRDDFFKQHCKVFANRPFVWHIWDGRKDGFSALVNYHRLDRAGLEKLTYTYLGDWIERQRADGVEGVAGADIRLAAARELKGKLEAILEGEPPYDIYVRWKELHEQPVGWEPDLTMECDSTFGRSWRPGCCVRRSMCIGGTIAARIRTGPSDATTRTTPLPRSGLHVRRPGTDDGDTA